MVTVENPMASAERITQLLAAGIIYFLCPFDKMAKSMDSDPKKMEDNIKQPHVQERIAQITEKTRNRFGTIMTFPGGVFCDCSE